VAIAGGDTNSWDGPLVVSVTAFGEVTPDGPLCRGGAKPGDRIVVTGSFGGSILGRHLDIEPRVKESLLLNQRYRLHAAIDSSDGLSLDLWRICQASSLGAVVNVDRVPIAPAAYELAKRGGNDTKAITHALADGEDFELILAAPADSAAQMLGDQPLEGVLLSEIGEFCAEQRLLQQNSKGERKPLEPRGFEHPLD
jgi:thiamine-monophosphate kinase